MKLKSIDLFEVRIPFRLTFRHATQARSQCHALLVKVTTEAGVEGWGEVHPRPYLTGETIKSCQSYCRDRLQPALFGIDFTSKVLPWDSMSEAYIRADSDRALAIWAGIDIAVTDAWSRTFAAPLAPLLKKGDTTQGPQGISTTVEVTAPIGLAPLPVQLAMVLAFRALGHRHFKIKIDDAGSVANLSKIRLYAGKGADLRVDVNGVWDLANASNYLPRLADAGVSVLEQPLPAAEFEGLATLQKTTAIDIMADESYCTLSDAKKLAQLESCRMWNFRLGKNGGFTAWQYHRKLAEEHQITLQLGSLVGELGPLPAATSLIRPISACRYFEYGFPAILVADNPFRESSGLSTLMQPPILEDAVIGVAPPPSMKIIQKYQLF